MSAGCARQSSLDSSYVDLSASEVAETYRLLLRPSPRYAASLPRRSLRPARDQAHYDCARQRLRAIPSSRRSFRWVGVRRWRQGLMGLTGSTLHDSNLAAVGNMYQAAGRHTQGTALCAVVARRIHRK